MESIPVRSLSLKVSVPNDITTTEHQDQGSAWEPLRLPMFRFFWFASLASNLGTWIHEVGAGWLMATLQADPEWVAAVRTAMALPIVLLAIPAGVVADRIDKRRLLIATQMLLFGITALLTMLVATDHITANGLLLLTFLIGLGMVVHVPTWQSTVPELVPRSQLARAVGLGSISFNLARALGPALGGVLIALLGVWSAFAINAASFAGVVFVLLFWKRDATESSRGRSFLASTWQGMRFVARNQVLRHVMVGVLLFVMPGSALWSLLPLFAKQDLGWGPQGFGILVAALGVGAVSGASVLPNIRRHLGGDGTIGIAMMVFSIGLFSMTWIPAGPFLLLAPLVMGLGWMATLTTLNASAQVTLPQRLRARGMGCYLTMMAFSMTSGSQWWGHVAAWTSVASAFRIAAIVMVGCAVIRLPFRVHAELGD
ncbi:MAG: MFS transporter [Planctomycetota bacterium]